MRIPFRPAACALALALPGPASAQVSVTVSPSPAQPGETITVTITNTSPSGTIVLPSSCAFAAVHSGDCDGPVVFAPACLAVLTPLPPGASKSQTWDQTDLAGNPVGPGPYGFEVRFFGTGGEPTQVCALGSIQSCVPANYGAAKPGSGGFAPSLSSNGQPAQIGNAAFQVVIGNGVGGASGVLFVATNDAAIATPYGTLLVDPSTGFNAVPVALGGAPGTPGAGSLAIPAPIPNLPGLVGAELFVQVFLADAGAVNGAAHTAGLAIRVCG